MKEEFGSVISIAKAAEMLNFVVTPGNDVMLTNMGREFIEVDPSDRKFIFRKQILRLQLFRFITEKLHTQEVVTEDELKEEINDRFPYENEDKMVDTIVDWGRYGEIFEFNANLKIFQQLQS
jgi:NitT/TauT family transport system ATP-binding protein